MKRFNSILVALGLALVSPVFAEAADFSSFLHHRPVPSAVERKVLSYAERELGQQVGNGECWTLAYEALKSAGAHLPGTKGYGTYVFGTTVAAANLRAGDIIQFENVRFEHHAGGSYSYNEFPHHTAVVESVSGGTIHILQQNVNGDRHVQHGSIVLADKVRGSLTFFRPQPR